jgi:AbrB family looped-hinge helix DNA binding protein
MLRSKVTTKGQVTIPRELRESFGIEPGDEVEFLVEDHSIRLQKRQEDRPFARWRGYLRPLEGRDVDALIEEMRGR